MESLPVTVDFDTPSVGDPKADCIAWGPQALLRFSVRSPLVKQFLPSLACSEDGEELLVEYAAFTSIAWAFFTIPDDDVVDHLFVISYLKPQKAQLAMEKAVSLGLAVKPFTLRAKLVEYIEAFILNHPDDAFTCDRNQGIQTSDVSIGFIHHLVSHSKRCNGVRQRILDWLH